MENFKIIFCWSTPLPIKLKYNGEVLVKDSHEIIVRAYSMTDVIRNLSTSDPKTVSNINNIVKC